VSGANLHLKTTLYCYSLC